MNLSISHWATNILTPKIRIMKGLGKRQKLLYMLFLFKIRNIKTFHKKKKFMCELKIMGKVRRVKDMGMIEIIRKKQRVFF